MADLTPARELRAAARLMRDRAALVPPPPWDSYVHDVTAGGDGLDVVASSGLTVRAQYVASWHPGVALAVADLLDKLAWTIDVAPDALGASLIGYATSVARASLGTKEAGDA